MAKVIGQVESLKTLRDELNRRNISRFNSIGDINRFNKEYTNEKRYILNYHENRINKEIDNLSDGIRENERKLELKEENEKAQLNSRIENYSKRKSILEQRRDSFLRKLLMYFKIRKLKRKIKFLKDNFQQIINDSIRANRKEIYDSTRRLEYLSDNKQEVLLERSRHEIAEIEYAKKSIDELGHLIAGAIGENLVEKEIRKLSDDYILINDYRKEFSPPIYNKKTHDRIYSIQLDHLVISRSGIFILETKNWSKKSIDSLDLRSPVDQIIRTSYALFRLVNSKVQLNFHHWGTKQIPIRNIIVMIHEKPKNQFQYVKIKLLRELNNYLEYFDPVFSKNEVDSIANYLVERRF